MEDWQRYKKQYMYEAVMSYLRSGLSQEEYCKTNNFPHTKLRYWYKKYKLEPKNEDSFVPIAIESAPQEKSRDEIKIILPNGIVIQVMSSAPEAILHSLISQI